MDNSSVLESNNNSNLPNEEKPKGKLNKKIIIISSLITVLIISFVVFFIISSKYSRMVEDYINTQLNTLKEDIGEDFKYSSFKCSGLKNITCSSEFIELSNDREKVLVKNISFTASPSLNKLHFSSTGSLEIGATESETNHSITLNFNCSDNMTLLSDRSLLAHDVICDTKMQNIHSIQNSVLYMKDDVYKECSSMIGVLTALSENKIDFMEQFANKTVLETSYNKIESPALLDDFIEIMQVPVKLLQMDEAVTKDTIVFFYEGLKNEYNKLKSLDFYNAYTAFADNFIEAIDNVIYNNHNMLSISMTLKDKSKIDEMFDAKYLEFMLPDIYDVNVKSSK